MISQKSVQKIQFHKNLTKIKDNSHEAQRTFITAYRWIHLRMRNVSEKRCRDNKNFCFCL